MSSPKLETIALYDPTTGIPLTGQAGSMSFDVYTDDTGSSLSAPTITEIGSTGVYKFLPTFVNPAHGIVYILNCGAAATPRRTFRYMRPEDYNADNADVASSTLATASTLSTISTTINNIAALAQALSDIELGQQEVFSSGSDANRLVLYKPDGVTVIAKFDLQDQNGVPTVMDPFRRIPV